MQQTKSLCLPRNESPESDLMTLPAKRIDPLPPTSSRLSNPSPTPTSSISPAASSGNSTPLNPSPQIATFDNFAGNVFSKSLINLLNCNCAAHKEVRNCILANNEARLKE